MSFSGAHNEWDPLEEVIVGIVDGACVPEWDLAIQASMPSEQKYFYQQYKGQSFPLDRLKKANEELEEFVKILETEGIKVRRPEPIDHSKPYSTPSWNSISGLYQAMPRDLLLIVGDLIIETPMAWRSRYFEINAYRKLLKEYFADGARWVAAPKPELLDELYEPSYTVTNSENNYKIAITEFEPVFDAADFIRCGTDIIGQLSNVTNQLGVDWLQSVLGEKYKIHLITSKDKHPMHIDSTFMPLAPGYLLINPGRDPDIPSIFKDWKILKAPVSKIPNSHPMYMSSTWISTVNVLMLDEKRVVIETQETEAINLFKENGFEPIPCNFRNFMSFGGSFHCATLDVKRRGTLQSYF